jgi:hypothetical protein
MSGQPNPKWKYKVMVDDNFHYMDLSERYRDGAFDSCEAATEKCKQIVDTFLLAEYQPMMTARQLLGLYKSFGEDPFIVSMDEDCTFSAWDYAERRCREMCGDDS